MVKPNIIYRPIYRLVAWIMARPPLNMTIVTLGVGVAFALGAVLVNVADFRYVHSPDVTRQVGFFWALNWSVTFLIGFPVMAFLILSAARGVDSSFKDLALRKMVVEITTTGEWLPVDENRIRAHARPFWESTSTIGAVIFLVVFGYLMAEWFKVSGEILWSGQLPIRPGQVHWFHELDWSVAAVLDNAACKAVDTARECVSAVTPYQNLLFSFFAYFWLAVFVAILFAFYAFVAGFASFINDLSNGTKNLQLVPDAADSDPRCGFQIFGQIFRPTLHLTFAGFLMCYLMRLQNLYLRDKNCDLTGQSSGLSNCSKSIDEFAFGDIKEGFKAVANDPGELDESIGKLSDAIFATGNLADLSSFWAIVLIAFFFVLVLLILAGVLRFAAQRSRDSLAMYLRARRNDGTAAKTWNGVDADEVVDRLTDEKMDFWPVRWPQLNELLVFLTFGFVILALYKLGLIWAGLRLARLFVRLV